MRQFPRIFSHCVHWGDNHTHFFPQCLDPESDSSQLKYCAGSTCSFIFSGRKRRAKSQEIHDDDHMMKSQFPLKSFKIKATFKIFRDDQNLIDLRCQGHNLEHFLSEFSNHEKMLILNFRAKNIFFS